MSSADTKWLGSLLFLLLAMACSPEEHGSVGNSSSDSTLRAISKVEAEIEYRIDGYDADLVPITGITVGPHGTLAILQRDDHVVRFFSASGAELGTFGRQGKGPGEFEFLVNSGLKGDTLWVSDTDLARLTLISPQRELVRLLGPIASARPTRADSSRIPVFPFVSAKALYPGDTILVFAQWAAGDPIGAALGRFPLLRVSTDGLIRQVVLLTPDRPKPVLVAVGDGPARKLTVPFLTYPLVSVSPDGSRIVIVTTDFASPDAGSILVEVFDAAGKQLMDTHIPFVGDRIAREVIDSILAARIARATDTRVRRAIDSQVRARIPAVYPPVVGVVIGRDRRIWIGLRAVAAGNPWLVLDDEARLAGQLTLPLGNTLEAADASHIWAIEQDSMDVESVICYRLSAGSGS